MPTTIEVSPEDGLCPQQRAAICGVFRQFPQVEKAKIYGSRAMGTHRPGSDIDLTLLGEINLSTLNQISLALDDLLLPFEIDLSVFAEIDNPQLQEHIRRVGKLFYANPDTPT
ncbi:MAG: nucleotidyltransferase domain-containing protein [Haliea sp.]